MTATLLVDTQVHITDHLKYKTELQHISLIHFHLVKRLQFPWDCPQKQAKRSAIQFLWLFMVFSPYHTSMIKDPKLKQSCCEVQLSLSTSSAQKKKKTFQDFSLRKSLGLLGHKSKQVCIHNSSVLLHIYFLMIQFCCHGKGRGLSIMTATRDSGFDYNLTRSNCLSTQSTLVRVGDIHLLCM